MFKVGDNVKWISQAAGTETEKRGVVVRVVQKHETPAYRIAEKEFTVHRRMFDGFGIPGGSDVGYFVEVRDGKTARSQPKPYFPYPSALRSA
jgi:hypothetical protein